MNLRDRSRTWLVTGLKVLLPLVALSLLGTLFLFSRAIDPTRALPFSNVDVDDLARDPRISGPRFATVADDGTAMTLTADSARVTPGPEGDSLLAERISVALEAADGRISTIRADAAQLDQAAGTLLLEGNIHLHSAEGYDLHVSHLSALLDRTRVESNAEVLAEGPLGQISAGGMLLVSDTGGHVLVFTRGVKLIYQP